MIGGFAIGRCLNEYERRQNLQTNPIEIQDDSPTDDFIQPSNPKSKPKKKKRRRRGTKDGSDDESSDESDIEPNVESNDQIPSRAPSRRQQKKRESNVMEANYDLESPLDQTESVLDVKRRGKRKKDSTSDTTLNSKASLVSTLDTILNLEATEINKRQGKRIIY